MLTKLQQSVVRKAIKTIEKGWCTGHSARRSDGSKCGVHNKEATVWCMEGALLKNSPSRGTWSKILNEYKTKSFHPMYLFNDVSNRTKEQVLERLRRFADGSI